MSSNSDRINRRLNVFLNHIQGYHESMISREATNASRTDYSRFDSKSEFHNPTFNVDKMGDILRGDMTRKERYDMYKILDNPVLSTRHYNCTKEEARQYVAKQSLTLLQTGFFKLQDMKKDPVGLLGRLDTCTMIDGSLGIKLGVQMVLFGGSVLNLGTKIHHDKYLKKIETFELPGCFGMTELHHGSNVRKLETTATYDPKTEEFVIHTPHDGAIKWWLGNAQLNAKMCTVFARLITQGKDYGIHAILVPIRDQAHNVLPGVTIGDCGDKVGLHGVDNGFIKFDQVRVPRENLLNRFGDVKPDGTYVSEITSEGRRFAAVLGELITGRMSLSLGSLNFRKMAVTIAIRFAANRLQFGPPSVKTEIPILDYRSHQIRLMPILASCYAGDLAKRELIKKFSRIHLAHVSDEELTEVHALTAGVKAVITWDTQKYLQTMRETCGGHGYSAYNRFGQLRNDHDIYQTFEGDNTVLIQQLAGFLLKRFAQQFKGQLLTDGVKYIRKQMGVLVRERNPVITRYASKKHLRNPDFQLQAFEYRTAKLLQTCASDIQAHKKKVGVFQAWNDVVPKMVRLGRAYVEQFMLEQFVKECDKHHNDTEMYNILKLSCDLFALNIMKQNIGDFLDVIKRNKANAIGALVEQLCEDMREHAVSMVDAFEIPDFILDAPIGLSKGNYVDHVLEYAIKHNPKNRDFPVGDNKKSKPAGKDDASDLTHDVMEVDL